jgi:hypothetical protein
MTTAIAPHHGPLGSRLVMIVSLGRRAAARWARKQGLSSRQWQHVDCVDDFDGRRNVNVVWLGPVWERSDFFQVCDAVDAMVREGRAVVDRREIPLLPKAR